MFVNNFFYYNLHCITNLHYICPTKPVVVETKEIKKQVKLVLHKSNRFEEGALLQSNIGYNIKKKIGFVVCDTHHLVGNKKYYRVLNPLLVSDDKPVKGEMAYTDEFGKLLLGKVAGVKGSFHKIIDGDVVVSRRQVKKVWAQEFPLGKIRQAEEGLMDMDAQHIEYILKHKGVCYIEMEMVDDKKMQPKMIDGKLIIDLNR